MANRVELEALDIALRGAATGICVVQVALFWASRITRQARLAFVLMVATLLARLWSTTPLALDIDDPLHAVLRAIGAGTPFFVAWFLVLIFLDDKRFGWAWLLSGALISVQLLALPVVPAILPLLQAHGVAHYGALIALFLWTGRDDLQDARRRMRPLIAWFLLVFAVGMSLTSTRLFDAPPVDLALGHSVAFLLNSLVFALWALKANIEHWPGETDPPAGPSPVQRRSEQSLLITRIEAEMKGGIWQVEGLTVGALAQRVKAPEHQVRRAINQELGHRNFASFINAARIEAAKTRLSAPEAADRSIQEIAYDVGFASLGPFNRAFREATGLSPTDYRKQALTAP